MTASRRSVAVMVVAAAIGAVCVRLGIWQLDRLEQRRAVNAAIVAGLAGAPLSPAAISALSSTVDTRQLMWRPIRLAGVYDPANEVLLYGRPLEGRAGDHVLTPLVLDDGSAVVIDRGWVPFDPAAAVPLRGTAAPPTGRIVVDGVIMPPEDPGGDAEVRDGRVVRLGRVDLSRLASQLPYEVAPVAVLLRSQEPGQLAALPRVVAPPVPDEGPHLSYAFQWFTFAAVAVIGGVVLVRRGDAVRRRAPDDRSMEGPG